MEEKSQVIQRQDDKAASLDQHSLNVLEPSWL